MRDYFAALFSDEVTGVTKRNTFLKSNEIAAIEDHGLVTPQNHLRCNRCNMTHKMLHPVTPLQNEGVTSNTKEIGTLHPLHLVTPQNEELLYFYNERAGIIEFEGKINRNEAERLAFKEGLNLFFTKNYPEILEQFESLINTSF